MYLATMKLPVRKWIRIVISVVAGLIILAGMLFGYVQYQIYTIKKNLFGATLVHSGFFQQVPFDFPNKVIVVKVHVNGSSTAFDFILDTGAPTAITQTFLQQLGGSDVDSARIHVTDTTVAVRNSILKLKEVMLGGIRFTDVGALVIDDAEMGMFNCIGKAGIIGCNILACCQWQIRFGDSTLVLTDQPERLVQAPGSQWVPFSTLIQKTPVVSVRINDTVRISDTVRLNLTLDTGFNGDIEVADSALVTLYRENHPECLVPFSTRPSITIAGDEKDRRSVRQKFYWRISRLHLGELSLPGGILTLSTAHRDRSEGLIGNGFLEHFTLTLDYSRKRFCLSARDPHPLPSNQRTFGIQCAPFGEKIIISRVLSTEFIRQQGFSVGDQILEINGQPTSGYTKEDLCRIFRDEIRLLDTGWDTLELCIKEGDTIRHVSLSAFDLFPE